VLAGVRRLLKPVAILFRRWFYAIGGVTRKKRCFVTGALRANFASAGALYWSDFSRLARRAGFPESRLVSDRPLAITDPDLSARHGPCHFFSATHACSPSTRLEESLRRPRQGRDYQGGIAPAHPHVFSLRQAPPHPRRGPGVPRLRQQPSGLAGEKPPTRPFQFIGSFDRHYGPFLGCGLAAFLLTLPMQALFAP